MFGTMFARYQAALLRSPLKINLLTAVPLMVMGDSCAQLLEARNRAVESNKDFGLDDMKLDAQRLTLMSSYSGLVFTPVFFYAYKIADKLFSGPRLLAVAQKTLFVGIIGGIPCNGAFLSLGTTLEMKVFGKKPFDEISLPEAIATRLEKRMPELMKVALLFWLPMDALNFAIASPKYRILFTSGVTVAWNCYLSMFANAKAPRPPSCGGQLEQDVVAVLQRCLENNPRRSDQDEDQNIRDCLGEVQDLLDLTRQLKEDAKATSDSEEASMMPRPAMACFSMACPEATNRAE